MVDEGNSKQIILIGDSTLDNKLWVDGVIKNYIFSRIGIKPVTSIERIKKSHRSHFAARLSVVEHLTEIMPDYTLHNFANDGFTTSDCLNGAYRDKVFGKGNFLMYPHEFFEPLKSCENIIKQSDCIAVSIGGNDFREFLLEVNALARKKRQSYIKTNFQKVIITMQQNYINIIRKITELNNTTKLIIMTQYYPSFRQNSCRVYPFMREVGAALSIGGADHDPLLVIQALIKMVYSEIFAQCVPINNNIVVADITSSLNPFDKKNYLRQVEPSGQGGKKIAQILKYLILSEGVTTKYAYRFAADYFADGVQTQGVSSVQLQDWEPLHPNDMKNL